jgi:uncharacterized protein GlcG (DUF336 family)
MNTKTIGTYVLEHLETGAQAKARYPKAALRKARAMGSNVEIVFVDEAGVERSFTRIDAQLTDEAAMRELKRMQRDPLL